MLWRRAAPPFTPSPVTPVPDGESVRMAALKTAWRRDRWVSRRRVMWRWTLWSLQRHFLPAAVFLAACASLWIAANATLRWVHRANGSPQIATSVSPASPPVSTPVPQPTRVAPQPEVVAMMPPRPLSHATGLVLNFDRGLHGTQPAKLPVSSAAAPEAAKSPNPQLIFENWLNSKEP